MSVYVSLESTINFSGVCLSRAHLRVVSYPGTYGRKTILMQLS